MILDIVRPCDTQECSGNDDEGLKALDSLVSSIIKKNGCQLCDSSSFNILILLILLSTIGSER
jgi:hypothetical protein